MASDTAGRDSNECQVSAVVCKSVDVLDSRLSAGNELGMLTDESRGMEGSNRGSVSGCESLQYLCSRVIPVWCPELPALRFLWETNVSVCYTLFHEY